MKNKIEREKRKEVATINDTLSGNYWAGGEGYGMGAGTVSNLLYDAGAKGGKTASKRNQG